MQSGYPPSRMHTSPDVIETVLFMLLNDEPEKILKCSFLCISFGYELKILTNYYFSPLGKSNAHCTKNEFFIECDQICRKLRIWSHLLEKYLMENFIFC